MHFGPDGKLYIAVGETPTAQQLADADQPVRQDAPHQRRRHDPHRQPVLQPDDRRQPRHLGARACATRSRSRSARHGPHVHQRRRRRTPGRRSTRASRAPTTAGRPPKGPTTNPHSARLRCLLRHGTRAPGLRDHRRRVLQPGAGQFPAEYVGNYFFADYFNGWISQLDDTAGAPPPTFATGISSPVDLAVGPTAACYYLARGSRRRRAHHLHGRQAPAHHAAPGQPHRLGRAVRQFTVAASGAPRCPISGSATAPNRRRHECRPTRCKTTTLADNGAQFRAVVTNASGSATSNAAMLTSSQNQPPVPTIITPGPARYTRPARR